jgi:hypothetical protein
MSIVSLGGIASSVESILATALQSVGLTSRGTGATSSAAKPDSSQLSPLGQLLSTLQQLQQSNPGEYKTITQQIANDLQSAAQTAGSAGNTAAANQLKQLATDFTSASTSGQLPNIQDLAQAVAGGHGHHRHAESAGASRSSSNSLAQTDPLNPLNIINNTLTNAGLTGSNG